MSNGELAIYVEAIAKGVTLGTIEGASNLRKGVRKIIKERKKEKVWRPYVISKIEYIHGERMSGKLTTFYPLLEFEDPKEEGKYKVGYDRFDLDAESPEETITMIDNQTKPSIPVRGQEILCSDIRALRFRSGKIRDYYVMVIDTAPFPIDLLLNPIPVETQNKESNVEYVNITRKVLGDYP